MKFFDAFIKYNNVGQSLFLYTGGRDTTDSNYYHTVLLLTSAESLAIHETASCRTTELLVHYQTFWQYPEFKSTKHPLHRHFHILVSFLNFRYPSYTDPNQNLSGA